jgi:hypothetical protein
MAATTAATVAAAATAANTTQQRQSLRNNGPIGRRLQHDRRRCSNIAVLEELAEVRRATNSFMFCECSRISARVVLTQTLVIWHWRASRCCSAV